jgi:hypothetical protein
MDKKTRIIIIGSIVTFIFTLFIATFIFSHSHQNPSQSVVKSLPMLPKRSDTELLNAITSSNPSFIQGTQPTIAIVSVAKPQIGWYVVTLRQTSDPTGGNPAKMLVHDLGSNTGLEVLLGPGTDFPSDVTNPLHLPPSVLSELNS